MRRTDSLVQGRDHDSDLELVDKLLTAKVAEKGVKGRKEGLETCRTHSLLAFLLRASWFLRDLCG